MKYQYFAAGHLLLIRDGKVLLQKRQNTGYEDGKYGIPSGHIEGQETIREGTAREVGEEIGIAILPEDLVFAHIAHRIGSRGEYLDFFFTATTYTGTIENKEPEKCTKLAWFSLDALPDNTIGYVRTALEDVGRGVPYSEHSSLT